LLLQLIWLWQSAGFVVVGVEVGKFVDVLLVQNLCKFNRKIVKDWMRKIS
jgi:hypothetical protein